MPLSNSASSTVSLLRTPRIRRALLAAGASFLAMGIMAGNLRAGTLTITSLPPGATVDIDGVTMGKTPYQQRFSDAYFHKPHTVLARRLEHSMTARLSLAGYKTVEIKLTEGPIVYYTMNGKTHGSYWLLATNHFQVTLEKEKSEQQPAPPANDPAPIHDKTKTPEWPQAAHRD